MTRRRVIKRRKLDDVFDRWLEGKGIFYGLQNFDVPWKTKDINVNLDMEYHGNISGDKYIAPLVKRVIGDNETVTDNDIANLAGVIFTVSSENWSKQWNVMMSEYDPLENYNIKERMSNDNTIITYGHTITRADNLIHTKKGDEKTDYASSITRTDNLIHTKEGDEKTEYNISDTRTDNLSFTKSGSEISTPTVTKETTNSTMAFNSSTFQPTDKSVEVSTSGSDTLTFNNRTDLNTGTQTNAKSGNDKLIHNIKENDSGTQTNAKTGIDTLVHNIEEHDTGTQTNANTGEDETSHSYNLDKYGNIGFFTNQSMLKEERELWNWYYFYNVIFPDIDKILTLQIY